MASFLTESQQILLWQKAITAVSAWFEFQQGQILCKENSLNTQCSFVLFQIHSILLQFSFNMSDGIWLENTEGPTWWINFWNFSRSKKIQQLNWLSQTWYFFQAVLLKYICSFSMHSTKISNSFTFETCYILFAILPSSLNELPSNMSDCLSGVRNYSWNFSNHLLLHSLILPYLMNNIWYHKFNF